MSPAVRESSRRAAGAVALAVATAALLLVGLAVGAPPAAAHSGLLSSTPADGDQLDAPPSELVLEFNEDIQGLGTEIRVTAANEVDVTDGDPVVDGPRVTVPLQTSGSGDYDVVWRVVSADGHPISGELSFSAIAEAEPSTTEATSDAITEETTSSTSATTDGPSSAGATSDDDASPAPSAAESDDGSDAAPVAIVVVVIAAALAALVLVLRRLRARRGRP